MNKISAKLGQWMSVVSLASFIVYTVCVSIILTVNERYTWTDIKHLAVYEANQAIYGYIGMACMIIYACAFVVMVLCIGDTVSNEKKVFAKVASLFALAFCCMVGINYFVQITATRLQLQFGLTEGLTQFTQHFNISAINAINMLGWTFFYALSSAALSVLFDNSKTGKTAKWFCVANTLMMLLGLAGYIVNNFIVLLFTMNFGLGITGMGIIITMMNYFRKSQM